MRPGQTGCCKQGFPRKCRLPGENQEWGTPSGMCRCGDEDSGDLAVGISSAWFVLPGRRRFLNLASKNIATTREMGLGAVVSVRAGPGQAEAQATGEQGGSRGAGAQHLREKPPWLTQPSVVSMPKLGCLEVVEYTAGSCGHLSDGGLLLSAVPRGLVGPSGARLGWGAAEPWLGQMFPF